MLINGTCKTIRAWRIRGISKWQIVLVFDGSGRGGQLIAEVIRISGCKLLSQRCDSATCNLGETTVSRLLSAVGNVLDHLNAVQFAGQANAFLAAVPAPEMDLGDHH